MDNLGSGQGASERDPLLDRATRLFEFLAHAQQLKNPSPRTVDSYEEVLWLKDLPEHPAVTSTHLKDAPEPEEFLLALDRVPRVDPPSPDRAVLRWLDGDLNDVAAAPRLRDEVQVEGGETLLLKDHPSIAGLYEDWLTRWQSWAVRERIDRPVRNVYSELFATYVAATSNPEELELVLGVGCLAWLPPSHQQVRRHVLTAPVAIHLDDSTGRLTVALMEAAESVTVELDMLDPVLTKSSHIDDVRAQAQELQNHPLHREDSGELVRRLVHILDGDGEYRAEDEPPAYSHRPVATFAPAVMLRKRSRQGMVEIFRTVGAQLNAAGRVPEGVRSLLDPDFRPQVAGDSSNGALVMVDDDPFLPLPVNDKQRQIIIRVDTQAHTLVQGPPGTGKTHTAAALLAHLLAQGKRVLVTAQTDRALKEVRDKLPAEIRPLSVGVVGTSREDMSDLKVAVARIATEAADHDPDNAQATINGCLEAIDQLRRQRAALHRQLLEAREHEVNGNQHGPYNGTLAAIAYQRQQESEKFSWLCEFVTVDADSQVPLTTAEIQEWHSYLLDSQLVADEPDAAQLLVDLDVVQNAYDFNRLVSTERDATAADAAYQPFKSHPAFAAVIRLERSTRDLLQSRLNSLATETEELARRPESWLSGALSDVRSGRASIWQSRERQISGLIEHTSPSVTALGHATSVDVAEGETGPLVALAKTVHQHVTSGGKIKVLPDGSPKIGVFSPQVVKQAKPLFDRVRVNGLPPTTTQHLDAFLAWEESTRNLTALDRAWPDGTHIPPEDTLHERLQWHVTELVQLRRVLSVGADLQREESNLVQSGLPTLDWNDLTAVRTYANLVDAAAANDAKEAASAPLRQLTELLTQVTISESPSACMHSMLQAVNDRDVAGYVAAYGRLERLQKVRRVLARRDDLASRLSVGAPQLSEAIRNTAANGRWNGRLSTFADAWAWAATGSWVLDQKTDDVNLLQGQITKIEVQIRQQVELLSATRAWGHAVSPQRITGAARADLEQYAYLVRRLGKGTGKYAVQRRTEIRQAMDRCRPAVPVWIMPIYRIAEQLRIEPNMFDVVVIDEASQAGLEATFLQYLAPRVVVIGDDKQVSPAAVGVDQNQLRVLADQYLADDPYRASWQDPQRSLFDEAKMRYGNLLTLTEHRRCVPEIIGFSNRVAYEPDNIRLIPVRQYGADRLDPIKDIFLRDGYTRGTTNKINPVEAEAIVDQIEKCIEDPRYDGLSFGVISLLGKAQAKLIEKELLERIPPDEWKARDLRCGDSADFQGSERDVMFLSMVATAEPGKRLGALTQELYVQRYNVAASRAKDQMWLFHSLTLGDVSNSEDMRFQLLDYCRGVIDRQQGEVKGAVNQVVPENERVEPFDSLFEQRVFNRLVDHGYTVVPQYPAEGYKIDLVVVGSNARLAIECDGDAWHGPDAYERDLARQRDLERCGWQFYRIRESIFYVDQPGVLEGLWAKLQELDIHPSGWVPGKEVPPLAETPDTDR